jgi:hypothetical protein
MNPLPPSTLADSYCFPLPRADGTAGWSAAELQEGGADNFATRPKERITSSLTNAAERGSIPPGQ